LLGGGAKISQLNGNVQIIQSYPSTVNTWYAYAAENTNEPSKWTVTAYAICANVES
jgi:hypothetical protein